jgi:hypothetical protein
MGIGAGFGCRALGLGPILLRRRLNPEAERRSPKAEARSYLPSGWLWRQFQ